MRFFLNICKLGGYMNKKVFVTGGTGFVGSTVVEELLSRGFEVYCLVRNKNNLKWLKGLTIKTVEGSLLGNFTIPENIDYIIHVAGVTKANSYEEYYQGNVITTRNLISQIRSQKISPERIVGISSQAAAGPSDGTRALTEEDPPHPITWYGKSKLEAENLLMEIKEEFPVTIIRPPAVYGPRDKDVLQVFKFLKHGFNLKIGSREQYVSLVYVKNLAYGIVEAMVHPEAIGEIFYITDGQDYKWSEIIDIISNLMHKKYLTLSIPFPIASMTAFIIETLAQLSGKATILNRQKMLEVRESFWLCSSQKAREKIGYQPPFTTQDGIKETLAWYKENNWL